MKILVINTGSSSIKYQLFDMPEGTVMASGLVERIGESNSVLTHKYFKDEAYTHRIEQAITDHKEGLNLVVNLLCDSTHGVLQDTSEIKGVGHRVVHGGETFQQPTLIDEPVIAAIEANIPLAPLHNPANLTGIEVARSIFSVPQVAIFDTAFHQSIPPYAYHYALPHELYETYRIRRYGFHGTSHMFVAKAAAQFLGRPKDELNFITIHLGNGASIAAIQNGQSVDTSMGMTPLEGIIMGTRSGDIDPAIHSYLAKQTGKSIQEIDTLLNKQSGLKGICGSNDMRDILVQREEGNALAKLAVEMYSYRIKKYIGAYFAVLGKVDSLIFTAGIGQNSKEIRSEVCQGLKGLGIEIDSDKNANRSDSPQAIQTTDSPVKILVIPTNEELEIAEETLEVIST